ncbi:MAG TPA: hypothetical protein VMV33_17365 [Rhodocyclaceae bacterium]|nr:hypothetical protein [Rhodocyclaceae bacterium]
MTEEQIERLAERQMDRLDQRLIEGELTQPQYDAAVRQMNRDLNALARKAR